MEYDDPYKRSEDQVDLLNLIVGDIANEWELADPYFEKAIQLRQGAQIRLIEDGDELTEEQFLSNLCVWYGAGYLIQILGEYGICKHEMKRIDCGICSRNVLFRRSDD
tara:strand:- start:130 stop:453 length:324 start_codon:yes stop_codon:yes gene_type:complete